MQTIKIDIKNNKVFPHRSAIAPVGGNSYEFDFYFYDEAWNEKLVTARFEINGKTIERVLFNNKCEIEYELLQKGWLRVGLYAHSMATHYAEIEIIAGITDDGTPEITPAPAWVQVMGAIEEGVATALEVVKQYDEIKDSVKQLEDDMQTAESNAIRRINYAKKDSLDEMADESEAQKNSITEKGIEETAKSKAEIQQETANATAEARARIADAVREYIEAHKSEIDCITEEELEQYVDPIVDYLLRAIAELKVLGWNVPRECIVQNEKSGGIFIQNVGRVDLGSLDWTYNTTHNIFTASPAFFNFPQPLSGGYDGFCESYEVYKGDLTAFYAKTKAITISQRGWSSTRATIAIKDISYTDVTEFKKSLQNVYLYYPLVASITIPINGNEKAMQIAELKMLGWNVPVGCVIQNSINEIAGIFTQNVGRVKLDSLTWTYLASADVWHANYTTGIPKNTSPKKCYYKTGYRTNYNYLFNHRDTLGYALNDSAFSSIERIIIRNGSATQAPTGYFYYELVNPVTTEIDGNERLERLVEELKNKGVID